MNVSEKLVWYARKLGELPSLVWHLLFAGIYSTAILRNKAAATPYPTVRMLLMRRSGIVIGREVFVHQGVLVVGTSREPPALTLGDRVALGPGITFVASSEPSHSRLMHHPQLQAAINHNGPIVVEDDVWIGAHAVLMPGIRVGRGAVIGSGAVVTADVEPFHVVAGTPARTLRVLDAIE